jgi:predicted nucleotidyltransferase
VTHPVVVRRRNERRARLEVARTWADALAERLCLSAVVVVGSVARGDFNKWSDLDVVVIAEGLPDETLSRLELLMADSPPGLQAIGWTPAELSSKQARRDPLAIEAATAGVVVWGRLPDGQSGAGIE